MVKLQLVMDTLDRDVALKLAGSIAGGINYDILPLLSGVPIYGIVVGRGITAQPDPAQAAEKIAGRIREIWTA